MGVLSSLLSAVGVAALAAGLPPLFAPGVVRDAVPPEWVERVGDQRNWRGFGAGLVSIGVSTLLIAGGVAA
ncbi:MAG: hypothetical protein ABEH83_01625 [Halobacterium sp.]